MAVTMLCSHRGCHSTQPCKDHGVNATRDGYDHRWRKFRKAFLAQHPLCAGKWSVCERKGLVVVATDVDHERRVTGKHDPHFYTGPFNALCSTCHRAKTRSEQQGY